MEQYESEAIAIVQDRVQEAFNLNSEDKLSFVTRGFLIKLLEHSFFEPGEKND